MPASTEAAAAVVRDGEVLRFTGALARVEAARLWREVQGPLDGIRVLDLAGATSVDSAGLALLAELADRIDGVRIEGTPPGLAELRAAYRLNPRLGYSSP